MTSIVIAQVFMLVTLVLMITGWTPLYMTAILGSAIAAMVAGFPFGGADPITISKMIVSGLNPVLADMTGVLLFIGVMDSCGFLDVIIKTIIKVGRKMGEGAGVAAAGGIAAGIIGALTGFTQPVITGAITGPAAIKLGVDPNKAAGITAHAGHLGNFGGFTHPTQVAIIATSAVGFGAINVLGAITALSIFAISFLRIKSSMKASGFSLTEEEITRISAEYEQNDRGISPLVAFTPFAVLLLGFVMSLPIFLVGVVSGVLTIVLAKIAFKQGEAFMLAGVNKIATPIVATIGFLFMSTVIKNIGLVDVISTAVKPVLHLAPIQILFLVSALTGFIAQSYGASVAIIIPMLQVVLATGVDPLSAAFAAGAGASTMQYFLTGGPVAALATVIPVIPGCELRAANKFQRPSILGGACVAFVITIILVLVR